MATRVEGELAVLGADTEFVAEVGVQWVHDNAGRVQVRTWTWRYH